MKRDATTHVVAYDERDARAREAVAHLALAPGMRLTEHALFARLYGTRFEPTRHRKLLGVLVHRMRSVVASVAEGSKPQWIAQCSQRGSLPGP